MEREDYIIDEQDGCLGLRLTSGKRITPFVYDEITERDGIFVCRTYDQLDIVVIPTGEVIWKQRGKSPWRPMDSESRRELLAAIEPEVIDGYRILYGSNGKFSVEDKDGNLIFPGEYDELSKWSRCKVFEARKGNKWYYFDTEGKEILTDVSNIKYEPRAHKTSGNKIIEENIGIGGNETSINYGQSTYKGKPYTNGRFNNSVMQIKECVESLSDNHTYSTDDGKFIRLQTILPVDCRKMLSQQCERIKIPKSALQLLTDRYSYEYAGYILTLPAKEIVSAGMAILDDLGSFGNSWYFIDKFLTNRRTLINLKDFVSLHRKYFDEKEVLGTPAIGYGIDDTLSDGSVRWIHIEHYNEHCFPGYYEVGSLVREGSLEKLKNYVESIHWPKYDPFGGEFFHFGDISYTNKRSWSETVKVLDYLLEKGKNPTSLLKRAIWEFIPSSFFGEEPPFRKLNFYYKCIVWVLQHGAYPNDIDDGKSQLDAICSESVPYKDPKCAALRDKLTLFLRKNGAKTKEELYREEDAEIAKLDPHDYSMVNKCQ